MPLEKNAKTSTWAKWVIALGVMAGLGYLFQRFEGKKTDKDDGALSTKTATAQPSKPTPPKLPDKGLDASQILGQSKAKVRNVLGQPKETDKHPERGTEEDFYYLTDDVVVGVEYKASTAVALGVAAEGANQYAPLVRKWLALPEDGPVNLGGREYVVEAGDHLTRVEVLEAKFAADQAKRADKRTEEAGRKVAANGRSQYAANVEENFLKKGQNVKVRVTGTVLRVTWVLCDRATLYQLVDGEESTRPMLQGLGFTRVVCHDGYNEGAYTNL